VRTKQTRAFRSRRSFVTKVCTSGWLSEERFTIDIRPLWIRLDITVLSERM